MSYKVATTTILGIITIIITVFLTGLTISHQTGSYIKQIQSNTDYVKDDKQAVAKIENTYKEINSKIDVLQTDVKWLRDTIQYIIIHHKEYHSEK